MSAKKIIYDHPQEGTYHFNIYEYESGALIPAWCSCKVIGETALQYKIQICAALPKHKIGDFMWVHKRFVKFKS